jgi:hypothetical protein
VPSREARLPSSPPTSVFLDEPGDAVQLTVYYMLVPTSALTEAAQAAGEQWLLEPDVWIDVENDRTGRAHPQADVEGAAWKVFLAKLASGDEETDGHRRFRKRCLELGFRGCWSVFVARAGDPVEDLFDEAQRVEKLAAEATRP